MKHEPLLHIEGLQKSFAGTVALSNASLTVYPGEVHALMGQNGAGKSTLIKALTGVYTPDSGSITFHGKQVSFRSPYEAQNGGISTIYQEINLVGLRSVAENVFLGKEIVKAGRLDQRSMLQETSALLGRLGIDLDPRLPLEALSTAAQQMVAIARALSFDAKLVIMDEPTSSLHDREVDTLFEVIKSLKGEGVAVIFTSHKLDELYRICDRVTVLRDGQTTATANMDEISRIELVAEMLGKDPKQIEVRGQTAFTRPDTPSAAMPMLLDARNVASGNLCHDASLSLRAGEVVGVAGLLGSGRSEFAGAVFGSAPLDSGTVEYDKASFAPRSPRASLRRGLVVISEDRKTTGLVGAMSIGENISLSILRRLSKWGVVNRKKERQLVDKLMKDLGVKANSRMQPVEELSGGNQQKVVLARALACEPKVLILDEPTRGVDVGAKQEIQRLISELVTDNQDRGVIMISSEMEEIIEGSNRIMIMRDGITVAFLDSANVTNGQLMLYMASGADESSGVENESEVRR